MPLTKSSHKVLLCLNLFSLMAFIIGCDNERNEADASQEMNDTIIGTTIYSDFVQEDYPLLIYLPPKFESKIDLPVIYLTDGASLFNRLVQSNKEIGFEAIVVGIGDQGNNRGRDFLSGDCGGEESDGFLNFYNFITQELVPYIDDNYDNNHNYRSLVGHSLGGSFAALALFMEDPDNALFYRFLSIDPAFYCDSDELDVFLQKRNLERVEIFRLFHSQSFQLESKWFNDYLNSKNFSWIETRFRNYETEDHVSVVIPSFKNGMKFIYDLN